MYDLDNIDLAADNDELQADSADILDFTEINPFSEMKF
jgi:hypothetical protein